MKQSLTQSLKLPLALGACGFALLAAGAPADAAGPSIVVGSHNVLPGTTQAIQFNVSGGDAVGGLNLSVQVGRWTDMPDPDPDSYVAVGPLITALDVTTGTIFQDAVDPTTFTVASIDNRLWSALLLVDASTSTVSASGRVATVTLDTTGVAEGVYELRLVSTTNGDTDFVGLTPNIANGTITVVPEPASAAIFLLAAPTLLLRRRR